MKCIIDLLCLILISLKFIHFAVAVSPQSSSESRVLPIDLNSTPPSSPQEEEGVRAGSINVAPANPTTGTDEHQIVSPNTVQRPMVMIKSRKSSKFDSVPFKKVADDKEHFKFEFPPGTTMKEKKRVRNKERYERIKQNLESSNKMEMYYRSRHQGLTEAEKEQRRERQRIRYHNLSQEKKEELMRKIAQSNQKRRKAAKKHKK